MACTLSDEKYIFDVPLVTQHVDRGMLSFRGRTNQNLSILHDKNDSKGKDMVVQAVGENDTELGNVENHSSCRQSSHPVSLLNKVRIKSKHKGLVELALEDANNEANNEQTSSELLKVGQEKTCITDKKHFSSKDTEPLSNLKS